MVFGIASGRRRLAGVLALIASACAASTVAGEPVAPEPAAGSVEPVVAAESPHTDAPAPASLTAAAVARVGAGNTGTAPARTQPPSPIATRFASAVSRVEVEVMGLAVPANVRDSVARLWLLVGRPPTEQELVAAVRAVVSDGVPLAALADLQLRSPDRVVAAPSTAPEPFVAGLYSGILGRRGERDAVQRWLTAMTRGATPGDVAAAFVQSADVVALTATTPPGPMPAVAVRGVERSTSDSVLRLYLGLLARFPTTGELGRDVRRYTGGEPLPEIADDLMRSDEYRARRPAIERAVIVESLYEDVLGRTPTRSALAAWLAQLAPGASLGQLAVAFTESPAAVARTETVPPQRTLSSSTGAQGPPLAPPSPVDGSAILGIGDSIMLGASAALRQQLPGIAVDAEVGRQFDQGVAIVRRLAESGALPSTVVVHLGTNGNVTAARCDELMGLLAGKRVLLVNVRVPRPWEGPNNQVLAACAQKHGAELVDWNRHATGLAPDGYHLTQAGSEHFAATIAISI